MSNSTNFSLIVPVAADKPEYEGGIPYLFLPGRDGILLCIKSILGLELDRFTHIYFTILRKHADAFDIDRLLDLQFRRLGLANASIIILDAPTDSQAETVAKTIEIAGIKGAVFIKDADGYFVGDIYPENSVAVYPLEKLEVVDPRNKSYVSVDDMHYITNIIEKRVISHLFNAGGYGFEDAAEFLKYYKSVRPLGHIYLSHIIYCMLLEGHTFRPIDVTNYRDWGTSALTRMTNI